MQRHFPAVLLASLFLAAMPVSAQNFDDNASVTSPGGKKIIGALHEEQTVPPNKTALTEQDIATMKGGTGWGKLFQQLKMEGRYPNYRNLGELISTRNRLERASHAGSNSLQKSGNGVLRPERPAKPTRIEKFSRPERPSRPDKPNRP